MEIEALDGVEVPANARRQLIEFLISSSIHLNVAPVVKYTSLSLFADRFLHILRRSSRTTRILGKSEPGEWLLHPLTESNLQLFTLASIWISSKLHDMQPLSVKSLKALGDVLIKDQHFTTRDFVEAELTFLKVLGFNIGASNVAFVFLEDLFIQFRELSRAGELLSFHVCMDIMDILYESEETSAFYQSPSSLAVSILAASYVLTVPKQRWEFPVLPWVKVVASYKEEEIEELVEIILKCILMPVNCKGKNSGASLS